MFIQLDFSNLIFQKSSADQQSLDFSMKIRFSAGQFKGSNSKIRLSDKGFLFFFFFWALGFQKSVTTIKTKNKNMFSGLKEEKCLLLALDNKKNVFFVV